MKSNKMMVILALVFSVGFAEMVEGVTFEFTIDLGTTAETTLDSQPTTGDNVTTTYSLGTSPNLTTNLGDSDTLRMSSSFPNGQAITITPLLNGRCTVYYTQEWWGTNGNLTYNPQSPTWDLTLTDMQGSMPAVSDATVHVNSDGNQVLVEFWLVVTETVTFSGVQVDMNGPFPNKGSKQYHVRSSGFNVNLNFDGDVGPFSSIVNFP
ncbi:MAG: hypothetical protein GY780_18805 [bacterium]|nr:hypothetical protein [bacterium]